MKILGLERTVRLWDRLSAESMAYYQTLHDARSQARHIGPDQFSDLEATFKELSDVHRRLKSRFTVLATIGRSLVVPGSLLSDDRKYCSISDLVLERADWVFGPDVITGRKGVIR